MDKQSAVNPRMAPAAAQEESQASAKAILGNGAPAAAEEDGQAKRSQSSNGDTHFRVYKSEGTTQIKHLSAEERVGEIAAML